MPPTDANNGALFLPMTPMMGYTNNGAQLPPLTPTMGHCVIFLLPLTTKPEAFSTPSSHIGLLVFLKSERTVN